MTTRLIVTLDGPAGVGKTTQARRLAQSLGLAYLDTGAMFRFLALKLGPSATMLPEKELIMLCDAWRFSLSGVGTATVLACDGHPIGDEIRTEEVALLASRIAAVPVVRNILRTAQQAIGRTFSLVAEGRDMGTVVFPAARFKFFLDAAAEVRALRRLRDLEARGEKTDLASLTEQIRQRDSQDRNRAVAPLRPADDAMIIDTSDLSVDAVLSRMLEHIRSVDSSLC